MSNELTPASHDADKIAALRDAEGNVTEVSFVARGVYVAQALAFLAQVDEEPLWKTL